MNTNDLIAALGKVGKLFYDTMGVKLSEDRYPPSADDNLRGFKTILEATTVRSPEHVADHFEVVIAINLRLAPYARAYEWGSGEHSDEGNKYAIDPGKNYMIFPKEDWPDWIPWPNNGGVTPNKNGMFFLVHVEHPGVAAKPYIQPTIMQINDDVKKMLAHEFKVMVLRDVQPREELK